MQISPLLLPQSSGMKLLISHIHHNVTNGKLGDTIFSFTGARRPRGKMAARPERKIDHGLTMALTHWSAGLKGMM